MQNDEVGKKILDKALVESFVEVNDENYNSIRMMKKKSDDSGYKVIR